MVPSDYLDGWQGVLGLQRHDWRGSRRNHKRDRVANSERHTEWRMDDERRRHRGRRVGVSGVLWIISKHRIGLAGLERHY